MTLRIFPDEKLLMYQFLKKYYFRLRDIFNTLEFQFNERKKHNAAKKVVQILADKKPKHKILNKIAFYVYCRTHVDHLKPIYKHLDNESFVIILPDDLDFKESLIQEGYNVSTSYEIILSKHKFRCLVSLYMQLPTWILYYINKDKISLDVNTFFSLFASQNTRMVYSIGALPWNKSNTLLDYDEIFVCGPYEANIYNQKYNSKVEIKQVGYPKFDSFINNNDKTIKNNIELDCSKKTLLWLPTKDGLCSIDKYVNVISKLRNNYNVLLKPHPFEENSRIKRAVSCGIEVVKSSDSAPFYKIADFVFCDYGGSAFGALYMDKPILFLSPDNPYNDKHYSNDSPELILRKELLNIDDIKIDELTNLLNNESHWAQQKIIRKDLRSIFFLDNYGKSGRYAAKLLKDKLT